MPVERRIFPPPPEIQGVPQEIDIVDPSAAAGMTFDDMVINLDPDMVEDETVTHGSNLADFIEESKLSILAKDLVNDFESDKDSRKEWEEAYVLGLTLLGFKFEDRTTPWDGACGLFHPMLAESVVRFQAQTIQEIFPAGGPAKAKIAGNKTLERTAQSARVVEYLNHLATDKMVEYRNETEQLLFSLPIAGSAFRKMYFDKSLSRPVSMYVPAEDLVVSYGTTDLSTCERLTHIMRRTENWVAKQQASGFYSNIDLPVPTKNLSDIQAKKDELTGTEEDFDVDSRYTLLEMHVNVVLEEFDDGDGIALPYVITIDWSSQEVLSIYRNWIEGDPQFLKRDHFVHYQYIPGLGFYGLGLVQMIGGLAKASTMILRMLIDGGIFATLPAGLKTKGLKIKGDSTPIMPGEFRDVDVGMGSIKDNIAFLPYKEPSTVLYNLLVDMIQEGRRFASAGDLKASDMSGEAPVGTTLAILEKEMKVMSAVQARVHHSMGKELRILAQLVRDYGPKEYPYEVEGQFTVAGDFDDRIDVIPVSDPNAGTMAQRIMQYQAAFQLSAQEPQIYDKALLHRGMLGVLGIENAEKIIPLDEDLIPTDPVSENMNMINGKPVKAFMYQDHEAHITTHLAAAKHPKLLEMLKNNPLGQAMQASFGAHISEHLAMLYRHNIEKELGFNLPPMDETLAEDIEKRLSQLVAPAAAQLTGKAEQQMQAEKNAQTQKDPIIQLQERKQTVEEGEALAKAMEAAEKLRQSDAKTTGQKQTADEQIASRERIASGKLIADVVENQMKRSDDKAKQDSADSLEGFKLGMEIAEEIEEEADD